MSKSEKNNYNLSRLVYGPIQFTDSSLDHMIMCHCIKTMVFYLNMTRHAHMWWCESHKCWNIVRWISSLCLNLIKKLYRLIPWPYYSVPLRSTMVFYLIMTQHGHVWQMRVAKVHCVYKSNWPLQISKWLGIFYQPTPSWPLQ